MLLLLFDMLLHKEESFVPVVVDVEKQRPRRKFGINVGSKHFDGVGTKRHNPNSLRLKIAMEQRESSHILFATVRCNVLCAMLCVV